MLRPLHHHHLDSGGGLAQLFWGTCATLVVAFIFFAALGAFEPGDVLPLTLAAVALAALWLAHEWRQLWRDERR
jgi:hypothetical protein